MTAALEGGEWSAARPGRTLPPGRARYPFYRRLGGPQGRPRRTENLVPTGIRSVVSRYTDWATGPTISEHAVCNIGTQAYFGSPHSTRKRLMTFTVRGAEKFCRCFTSTCISTINVRSVIQQTSTQLFYTAGILVEIYCPSQAFDQRDRHSLKAWCLLEMSADEACSVIRTRKGRSRQHPLEQRP